MVRSRIWCKLRLQNFLRKNTATTSLFEAGGRGQEIVSCKWWCFAQVLHLTLETVINTSAFAFVYEAQIKML